MHTLTCHIQVHEEGNSLLQLITLKGVTASSQGHEEDASGDSGDGYGDVVVGGDGGNPLGLLYSRLCEVGGTGNIYMERMLVVDVVMDSGMMLLVVVVVETRWNFYTVGCVR